MEDEKLAKCWKVSCSWKLKNIKYKYLVKQCVEVIDKYKITKIYIFTWYFYKYFNFILMIKYILKYLYFIFFIYCSVVFIYRSIILITLFSYSYYMLILCFKIFSIKYNIIFYTQSTLFKKDDKKIIKNFKYKKEIKYKKAKKK